MATANAKARGWGDPGGPLRKKIAIAFERKHIITIKVGGVKVRCHRGIAPLVAEGVRRSLALGYKFDKVKDDWGYANRYIRGRVGILSNHAWGLAIDWNATKNPMTSNGRVVTDMPPAVVAAWTTLGFAWGGNYKGKRKDAMHYEFMGTPAQAAAIIQLHKLPMPMAA
jgi:D-alanyl-D-alanine carboxypeptidase